MPEPISAGIAAVSSIGSAVVQGKAAKKAASAQTNASNQAIAQQGAAQEQMRQLLQPYVNAGGPALSGLMDIAGIGGPRFDANSYFAANPDVAQEWARVQGEGQFNSPEEYAQWHYQNFGKQEGREAGMTGGQDAAFAAIENSPGFQAIARQGEEAILQNASATGGLRGGNTQGALARFRPALLDQFIERQFGRQAGIASLGQNAAAGVGNAGMNTAANIGNLTVGAGQAQAGALGAQGQIYGNLIGQIGGMAGNAFGGGMIRAPNASLLPSVNNTIGQNPGLF
jgi:hypothetical protein